MTFDRLKYIIEVTPAFGTPHPCPSCNDAGYVPHIGEYETLYMIGGKEMRECPLCHGKGWHRNRLTVMQREALAIFNDHLPEEGMLYPTITPDELAKLRAGAQSAGVIQEVTMSELALQDSLRGRLIGAQSISRFIEAGNARITVVSKKSGTRYTFRFSRPTEEETQLRNQPFATRPIWVSLLAGTDNENHYSFMGTIFPGRCQWEIVRNKNSKVGEGAPSMWAAVWLVESLYKHPDRLDLAEIWHEGSCGRCGRKLTVPDSIMTGFGPECAAKMGV